MPFQLASALEEVLPDVHHPDEPLAARDDFKRTVAFLVELDAVSNRAWFADQMSTLPQLIDDPDTGLRCRQADQLVVVALRLRRIE